MGLAGMPATTVLSGMSLVINEFVKAITLFPIETPGLIVIWPTPQKSSPILTEPDLHFVSGIPTNNLQPSTISPQAAWVQIFEYAPIPQLLPISNLSVELIMEFCPTHALCPIWHDL